MVRDFKRENSSILNQTIEAAYKSCIPLFVTIETTLGCNYKCVHCYNFDRSKPMPASLKGEPLSKEEFLATIDQVCKAGALYISFTGGEALLYPHLYDLISRVQENKSMSRLKTNGHLLTPEVCKKLVASGCRALDVSVYGADEKTYTDFAGDVGSFASVLSGIRNAIAEDMEVQLNLILHSGNCLDIGSMIKMAESLGVPYQFSDEITSRYDGTSDSQDLGITKEQYENLLSGPYKDLFWHDNTEEAFQCSCARNVVGIGLDGEVYPCIGAPIKSGNLRESSFEEIWNNSLEFKKIRDLSQSDFKECVKCEVRHYCNRSSGSAYVNTENYTGCDPMALKVAKIRKEHSDKF